MSPAAETGLLLLRLTIMAIMFFHGAQKLFGWWDGGGLDQAEGFSPARVSGHRG